MLLFTICISLLSCNIESSIDENSKTYYVLQRTDDVIDEGNTNEYNQCSMPNILYSEEEFIGHLKNSENPIIPVDKYIPLKELFPDFSLNLEKIFYYNNLNYYFYVFKNSDTLIRMSFFKQNGNITTFDYLNSNLHFIYPELELSIENINDHQIIKKGNKPNVNHTITYIKNSYFIQMYNNARVPNNPSSVMV